MLKPETMYRVWNCCKVLQSIFHFVCMYLMPLSFGIVLGIPLLVEDLARKLLARLHNHTHDPNDLIITNAIREILAPVFRASEVLDEVVEKRSRRCLVATRSPVSDPITDPIDMSIILPQKSCYFLSRLPQELRQMVYKLCVFSQGTTISIEVARRPKGGQNPGLTLHARPFYFNTFRPNYCWLCFEDGHRSDCDALKVVNLENKVCGRGGPALIQTCKLAYYEIIQLLYSKNQSRDQETRVTADWAARNTGLLL